MKSRLAIIPFVFLLCVIGAFFVSNPMYDRKITRTGYVDNGRITIDDAAGITRLDGLWSFYWKKFVTDLRAEYPDGYSPFPGSWKQFGISGSFGFASWGVSVSGLDPEKTYIVRVGQTLSACSVVINGVEIEQTGFPGSSKSAEIPAWGILLARFSPRSDGSADIILHVSNYHDWTGGTNAPIFLGEASLISRLDDSQRLADSVLFAVLSVLALFFVMLAMYSTGNRYFLWFAVLCLTVGFRSLCFDSLVLLDLFPRLPWDLCFRLVYFTYPVLLVVSLGFLRSVYRKIISRTAFLLGSSPFVLYTAIVLVAPEYITSVAFFFYSVCAFLLAGAGIWLFLRSKSRSGARGLPVFFVLFMISLIFFARDIFVALWCFPGHFTGSISLCLCLFTVAFMVLNFYSESFEKTLSLATQLQATNNSLKKFVPAEILSLLDRDSLADVKSGDRIEVEMAAMSSDIWSFTSIAEKMQPREVFEFLNEYLHLVSPIIRSNGGFIARYEGAGFLALFPQGPESAVRSAVQMQSAIISRNRSNPGKKKLTVGIGIDSGKLALGTISTGERLESAVFSSCGKCARKFEGVTREYHSRILISGSVFSGLYDPLAWFLRPVDQIDTGERTTFLFEIYNNDPEIIRDLKWKTQGDLERLLFAWFGGRPDEARTFLTRALAVFPDDPVLKHYSALLG